MSVDMKWLNERAGQTPPIPQDERTVKGLTIHTCKKCGTPIESQHTYCSEACRIEADKLTPMVQSKERLARRQLLRERTELTWEALYEEVVTIPVAQRVEWLTTQKEGA